MSKAKLKLTAICVALMFTLGQGVSMYGSGGVTVAAPSNLDLTSEDQTLNSFGDDFLALDKKRSELGKVASLTREDFDSLKSKAEDLRRRLSAVKNALQSAINKLKAADRWNQFDDEVLEGETDERLRAVFRNGGGARRLLEDTAAQAGSPLAADEIVKPVEALRLRIAHVLNFEDAAQGFSFVAASYNRRAGETFRCRLSSVRYSISKVTHGGQPTQAASNAWSKACRDATANPFN